MSETQSRRAFLQRAAVLPLAAIGGAPFAAAGGDAAQVQRVGGSHLRPALNAYSFSDLLTAGARDGARGLDAVRRL